MCAGLSDFRFLRCGFCGICFSFLVGLIVQKTLCQVVHLQVSMAYAAKEKDDTFFCIKQTGCPPLKSWVYIFFKVS